MSAVDSLPPGQYYNWDDAAGTSSRGYVASDGSRWKLLQAAGIVEVDGSGHRRIVSSTATGHPYEYVWQIDRTANTKSAWISRDDETGIVSVLFKRPAYQASGRFYQATVSLENSTRITDLQWVQTPTWASSVNLVSASRGTRLPAGIFRSTSEQYVPASARDLELIRNSDSRTSRALQPQVLRSYESTGRSSAPVSSSSILNLAIPE
ncbi:MAG: hypothetical protein WAO83_06820 [Fuerstiella sp.]